MSSAAKPVEAPTMEAKATISTVSVRPFQPKDQAALFSLWSEGFKDTFWHTCVTAYHKFLKKSDMAAMEQKWMENPKRKYYVAELDDGTVVGGAGLRMGPDLDDATHSPEAAPTQGKEEKAGEKDEAAPMTKSGMKMAMKARHDLMQYNVLDDDQAELLRMTVSNRHRRLGIGSKLLSAVEEHATSIKIERIKLCTGNPEAVTFYNKFGYKEDLSTGKGGRFFKMLK
eukprot:gene8857-3741_t